VDLPDGFDDGLTQYFELAARRASDETMSTWVGLRPDLVDDSGVALVGVVAYVVDAAVGMAAGFASLPNWVVTADMDLHLLAPAKVGPLRADSRVVRAGSRQVLADCLVFDEGAGIVVAAATANHSVLPSDRGLPMSVPEPNRIFRQPPRHGVVRAPLRERYGIRTVAGSVGVAEVDITGPARNPWGILHGSLFALLTEVALLDARPGACIDDLILRFVAPAREGPVRAIATAIDEALWRVDVRDAGADDRIACTSLARLS
jgi:acyl-coenzyme A thioesterase PaaI-like protein